MGTTHYLTTSDGEKIDNPRWYRKAEGKPLHNTSKHNRVGRKVATAGKKPCMRRLTPRTDKPINEKTL